MTEEQNFFATGQNNSERINVEDVRKAGVMNCKIVSVPELVDSFGTKRLQLELANENWKETRKRAFTATGVAQLRDAYGEDLKSWVDADVELYLEKTIYGDGLYARAKKVVEEKVGA